LELEFQISYLQQIPKNFNDYDFYEFIWWYERIAEERRKEEEARRAQENTVENQRRNLR
jgi:hypothetical protein